MLHMMHLVITLRTFLGCILMSMEIQLANANVLMIMCHPNLYQEKCSICRCHLMHLHISFHEKKTDAAAHVDE